MNQEKRAAVLNKKYQKMRELKIALEERIEQCDQEYSDLCSRMGLEALTEAGFTINGEARAMTVAGRMIFVKVLAATATVSGEIAVTVRHDGVMGVLAVNLKNLSKVVEA